jgi:PAS domain-containing protein
VLRFRDTLTRLRDAERELRDLNAELEQRISDRTAELNRTMQQARDSQAKLQAIVDTALDAVVRMDLDGRIVGWNRQAEMIFGWSRGSAGTGAGQDHHPAALPLRPQARHAALPGGGGGGVLDTRIEVYAPAPQRRGIPDRAGDHAGAGRGRDGFEFCAFIRDISERREREQKLVNANAMAEAANIAKSEFRQYEPRDPHADERRDRHGLSGAAHRDDAAPARLHQQDPPRGADAAGHHQRHPGFFQDRGGAAGSGGDSVSLEDVLVNVNSVTAQRAADKRLTYVIGMAPMCRAIWSAIRCGWARC